MKLVQLIVAFIVLNDAASFIHFFLKKIKKMGKGWIAYRKPIKHRV